MSHPWIQQNDYPRIWTAEELHLVIHRQQEEIQVNQHEEKRLTSELATTRKRLHDAHAVIEHLQASARTERDLFHQIAQLENDNLALRQQVSLLTSEKQRLGEELVKREREEKDALEEMQRTEQAIKTRGR